MPVAEPCGQPTALAYVLCYYKGPDFSLSYVHIHLRCWFKYVYLITNFAKASSSVWCAVWLQDIDAG